MIARALLALLLAAAGPARADDEPFDVEEIPSPGRTVTAEIADLDGDGRGDLLEVAFVEFPPRERRWIRVRFQKPDGSLGREPDRELPLPVEAAAYDLADLLPAGGEELVLLVPGGVRILSLSEPAASRSLELPGAGRSIGAAADERGLDRTPLVTHALGPEPTIVVPGLGESFLLAPSGEAVGHLAVGSRANYFVQPPGLTLTESDIQLFFDTPRLRFGDVDGDGRADAVAASRHEIRVFLRRPDGSFPHSPDRVHALARVSPEDHVRGSGAVRSLLDDIDADGRLDLVIAQISGGILDSRTTTSVFLNRGGDWHLEEPSAQFVAEHATSGVQLVDLDGDGRLELVRIRVPLNVLELIEVLVTREVDAYLAVQAMGAEGGFAPEPRFERKLGVPLSFETGRIRGFLPSFSYDWNADGRLDLLMSGDGSRIEVYLGGADGFRERTASQALDADGMLRSGDLDGDGLPDLVLFNPRVDDAPLRLGRNRGILPGTRPALRPGPGEAP